MLQNNAFDRESGWRNADTVCALDDGERHLGHILRVAERWHAFDATHFNDGENGFLFLGSYSNLTAAKRAVTAAVSVDRQPQLRSVRTAA